MSDDIDVSIGGRSDVRTPRGFAVYGSVTDGRGNVTRVQRSSAMGEPHCYVFCADAEGRSAYIHCGEPHAPSPHLDAAQARALAAALLRFADDARCQRAPAVVHIDADGRTAYVIDGRGNRIEMGTLIPSPDAKSST